MREILFRGKNVESGEWEEGFYVPLKDGGNPVEHYIYGKAKVLPETVGQFTGLTDKSGGKIFEGDIVKIDGKYIRYVVYSGVATGFVVMLYIDRQTSHFSDYLGNDYDNYKRTIEVIGNIHDNPELLEVTQ